LFLGFLNNHQFLTKKNRMAGWGKKKERNRVLTRKSGRNEGKTAG
jgi:hypothetical protein